ncbi:MAG: regulatory protein RecX [Chloroflexi bacterium]|nr:regulatory protein RecX [Chloroflexota bacterium]
MDTELPRDAHSEPDPGQTYSQCLAAALRFISYRPRTVREVARRLEGKFPPLSIDKTIAHLHDLHYLDDAAFCTQWITSRERRRPKGKTALRQELLRLGVDRGIIEQALDQTDEAANAGNAARKYAARLITQGNGAQDFRNKLGAYLQRRGFGYGTARDIATALWDEQMEA